MWNIRKIISKGDYDYALVPEHPFATKLGYVFMHRVVMENHLGRLLNKNEVVHHKNENKKDNRIENLQVMTLEEHSEYHQMKRGIIMADLICPWCKVKFSKPKKQTFLDKKNTYNFTCCSASCRGKLSREIQLHGLTPKVQSAISVNIVRIYRKNLLDNTEVTVDIQEP